MLKKEYDQGGLIQVEISGEATFEKDLITVNKTGKGRQILLATLQVTKPKGGKAFADALGDKEIDVQSFFAEIEDYKSEFAFNLLAQLDLLEIPTDFSIPDYICSGFKFME